MKTLLVITSINKPNKNIISCDLNCKKKNWSFVVIGDKKSPKRYDLKYGDFYSTRDQKNLKFNFSKICNFNSYARKNIGYLISIKNESDVIVETDDDNFPYQRFFSAKNKSHTAKLIKNKTKWINIYNLFYKKKTFCWPRGIPLNEIHNDKIRLGKSKKSNFFLQQGVCEGNPDVDAIYRLTNKKINIKFKDGVKINTNKSLVTTNSQNTIWFKEVFPLMYLPVTCTMRCTDIWRGLVTQKILHNDNQSILFFGTTMRQDRNDHDLMKDFADETPMYLLNSKINSILSQLKLPKGKKLSC